MLYPTHSPLEARTIIRGRNTYHPPSSARKTGLSLNCMFNGRGLYQTDEARFAVDDQVFLLLNPGRQYAFSIASETAVESLSVCLADEWLDQAHHALTRSCAALLDDPDPAPRPNHEFFETLYHHNRFLSPHIRRLRHKLDAGPITEPDLEETLRWLAQALLHTRQRFEQRAESIKAARWSTRRELWRRLHRAKDYMHAHLERHLPLAEIAAAAALAPHHFLRTFRAGFGVTPHAYLTQQRLERARALLAGTDQSVLSICLSTGFSSASSFSALFSRHHGLSPRAYRRTTTSTSTEIAIFDK